jgi:hypothetical protein
LPPIICRPSRADNIGPQSITAEAKPQDELTCTAFPAGGFTAAAAADPSDAEMRARERRATLRAYLSE